MIHQWFTHFGGIAILLFVVGFVIARACSNRHPAQTGEDKTGLAVETIFFGVVAAIVLVIALVLVCVGVSATYVGWVGIALLGITFGVGSTD
jgi:hypothetical protein